MRTSLFVFCLAFVGLSFLARDMVSGAEIDQPGHGAWYCSKQTEAARVIAAVRRGDVKGAGKLLKQYVSEATCAPGDALEQGTPITIKVAQTEVVVCKLEIADGIRFIAYYPQRDKQC